MAAERALLLAPAAEADLEDIWRYTARQWSSDQAERYHRQIVRAFADLANGTRRGRPTAIRAGYLNCPVASHMIYFRQSDERIEIVRVLHIRQDVEQHL